MDLASKFIEKSRIPVNYKNKEQTQ